jgi:ribonuclease P protein component
MIRRALSGSTIFSEGNLAVKAVANGLEISRLGVLVSAKFITKATARNRLRRQLYALVDMAQVTQGWDILVMVRKAHAH